jgi:hypothetical protein
MEQILHQSLQRESTICHLDFVLGLQDCDRINFCGCKLLSFQLFVTEAQEMNIAGIPLLVVTMDICKIWT